MKKTYREVTLKELKEILKTKNISEAHGKFAEFARRHFPKAVRVKFKILSEYNDSEYDNHLGAVIPLDASGRYIEPENENYVSELYDLIDRNKEPMEDIEINLSEQSTGLYILESHDHNIQKH